MEAERDEQEEAEGGDLHAETAFEDVEAGLFGRGVAEVAITPPSTCMRKAVTSQETKTGAVGS